MKVNLAIVISLDGRTTRGDEPSQIWASPEDKQHLDGMIAGAGVIITGRKTYEIIRPYVKLSPAIRRIILTRDPENYKNDVVPGQREFSNESPRDLISRLENEGYREVLLLSGEKLSTAFFDEQLISDIIVTVEPLIFGEGKGITLPIKQSINLFLIDIQKLNTKGTVLLRYKVVY